MSSTITAQTILNVASHYSSYAGYITFSTAIIGNLLNLLIFTRLKIYRNNRCIFYLIIESISNFLYQLFSISLSVLISCYGNDLSKYSLIWCRFKYLLAQSFGLITFYMICFQAVDQFFSTTYRFYLRPICTLKLGRCFACTTVCISILHSAVCTLSVNIVPSVGCTISDEIGIRYSTFFLYPVLAGCLPIVIASTFSLLAFRNVRRIVRRQIPIQRRRFDRQITAMILIRVAFFVLFSVPYTSYRIYTINANITQADPLRYAINRLISAIIVSIVNLNYAANFYIFFISSSRYRRQVKYVLMKKCWQRWKNWCCMKKNQVHPEIEVPSHSNNELE